MYSTNLRDAVLKFEGNYHPHINVKSSDNVCAFSFSVKFFGKKKTKLFIDTSTLLEKCFTFTKVICLLQPQDIKCY